MSRPPLRTVDLPLDRVEGEVAAALFFSDQRPPQGSAAILDWRLNGKLSELMAAGKATGKPGEQIVLGGNHKVAAPWALFVGCGPFRELSAQALQTQLRALLQSCARAGYQRVALGLPVFPGIDPEQMVGVVARAIRESQVEEVECLLSLEGKVTGRSSSAA